MQTYKYRFPAYGSLVSEQDAQNFTLALESRMKDSENCLGAWAMFPSDSAILDHITIDTDENYSVRAINLYTYTQLWEGREDDLKACVEENSKDVFIEDDFSEYDIGAFVEGPVEFLGKEGDIPKTLYHIAERKDIATIIEKGLIPDTGSNNYKDMEDHVYLSSEKDLAPWLAVLKHNEDPVILEVNTEDLAGIEPGRMFKDRAFVPDGYSEYRATETIPASAIKEADLTGEFCTKLQRKMNQMSQLASSKSDIAEVTTGMNRLNNMGILKIAEKHSPEVGEEMTEDDIDEFMRAINGMEQTNGLNK